jgi:hypothetical protein
MNSPVSCLPDPIQNMTKKRSKGKKRLTPRRTKGVSAPAAMGGIITKQRSPLPLIAGFGRTCQIQNYELVAANKSNALPTFANMQTSFSINPGIALAFPWLSSVALSYSKFRFRFLRYMYVPFVGTGTGGTSYGVVSYDRSDSAPTTLAGVSASDTATSGPTWMGGGINADKAFRKDLGVDEMIFVDVDVSRFSQPWYYVRQQAAVSDSSVPAIIYWGQDGFVTPNAPSTGNWFVSYIIDLLEPVLPASNL